MSVLKTLERYLLMRELKPTSQKQFRVFVNVFLNWHGDDDMEIAKFTGSTISKFLADKQEAGCSAHYRRSLRNHLKALHRFARKHAGEAPDEIRPVRLEELCPVAWTPEQVARLVDACDELRYRDRDYWRTIIMVGYYSGLNAIDIHRLQKSDIDPAGFIQFSRSKTGKRIFVGIPKILAAEILSKAPDEGPLWPRKATEEAFRQRFRNIVKWAKIPRGSFKQLRKTSGTLVELHNPGRGHRHLGNGVKIFEQHYEDKRVTTQPTMPPELPMASGQKVTLG